MSDQDGTLTYVPQIQAEKIAAIFELVRGLSCDALRRGRAEIFKRLGHTLEPDNEIDRAVLRRDHSRVICLQRLKEWVDKEV